MACLDKKTYRTCLGSPIHVHAFAWCLSTLGVCARPNPPDMYVYSYVFVGHRTLYRGATLHPALGPGLVTGPLRWSSVLEDQRPLTCCLSRVDLLPHP